ncbi:MAG: hypothetical protein AAFY72_09860, partial [Cyanobacteria bacterium J06649_4]
LSAKMYRKNATAIRPLSDDYRQALTRQFEPEILRLQELLDRDLSHWLNASARPSKTELSTKVFADEQEHVAISEAEMGNLEGNDPIKAA